MVDVLLLQRNNARGFPNYIKQPMALMKAACPAPGGGVTDARLNELVKLYGNDTMFLVGAICSVEVRISSLIWRTL